MIAQVDWWSIFQGNQPIIRRYTKVIKIHSNTTVFLPDWDPVDAGSWKKMMLPFLKNPWTVGTLVFFDRSFVEEQVHRHFRPRTVEVDMGDETTFVGAWGVVNDSIRNGHLKHDRLVITNVSTEDSLDGHDSSGATYPDDEVVEREIVLRVREGESVVAVRKSLLEWLGPENEDEDLTSPSYDWGAKALRTARVVS